MELIYWLLLFILFYVWIGYFLLLSILSRLKPYKLIKKDFYPYVSILLTVHNEEQVIEKRIKNLIEVDYPEHLLEFVVASDGSIDKTNSIVLAMTEKDNRIKLFKTEGGGKSYTQNKCIIHTKGDVIVLTDAKTIFNKYSIKNLTRNFADKNVGCISGRIELLTDNNSVSESQGFYWKYEMILRNLESKIGILHTASGQIMAFRKSLFIPFEDKYGDDSMIPLDIVAQGYKVVHDDDAIAYETFPSTLAGELKARIRMTLRNITGTLSKYCLLNPFRFPLISISILSHKILRWLTPYFMIILFMTNIFLLEIAFFYKIAFYCQVIFYFFGFVGFVGEKKNCRIPVISQIFSFILANVGFFLGVLKAIIGQSIKSYRNV